MEIENNHFFRKKCYLGLYIATCRKYKLFTDIDIFAEYRLTYEMHVLQNATTTEKAHPLEILDIGIFVK